MTLDRLIGSGRVRIRLGLLVATAAVAVALLPESAESKKAKRIVERDFTGPTSASAYSSINFATLSRGKGKRARRAFPFTIDSLWGAGAPLTCTGPPAPYQNYQHFPGYVGAVGSTGEPDGGRGKRMAVNKRVFSEHAVYEVSVYFIPKRIEYSITGRFTSPRTATGTLEVNTLWSHSDGTQTSCASGLVTWSACAWNYGDTDSYKPRPPCAGVDPFAEEPPPAEA